MQKVVRKPLPASDELTLKGVLGDAGFQRSSMLKELRYFCLLWFAEEAATGCIAAAIERAFLQLSILLFSAGGIVFIEVKNPLLAWSKHQCLWSCHGRALKE